MTKEISNLATHIANICVLSLDTMVVVRYMYMYILMLLGEDLSFALYPVAQINVTLSESAPSFGFIIGENSSTIFRGKSN